MASKYVLLVLACLLLVNTMGDSLASAESPAYETLSSMPLPLIETPPTDGALTPSVNPTHSDLLPPSLPRAKAPPELGGSVGPGFPSPLSPAGEADAPLPQTPPITRLKCIKPCLMRCKFHLLKMKCLSACLKCCNICKCVPPGPVGNKEECGKCYTGMITVSGKPKCP